MGREGGAKDLFVKVGVQGKAWRRSPAGAAEPGAERYCRDKAGASRHLCQLLAWRCPVNRWKWATEGIFTPGKSVSLTDRAPHPHPVPRPVWPKETCNNSRRQSQQGNQTASWRGS